MFDNFCEPNKVLLECFSLHNCVWDTGITEGSSGDGKLTGKDNVFLFSVRDSEKDNVLDTTCFGSADE